MNAFVLTAVLTAAGGAFDLWNAKKKCPRCGVHAWRIEFSQVASFACFVALLVEVSNSGSDFLSYTLLAAIAIVVHLTFYWFQDIVQKGQFSALLSDPSFRDQKKREYTSFQEAAKSLDKLHSKKGDLDVLRKAHDERLEAWFGQHEASSGHIPRLDAGMRKYLATLKVLSMAFVVFVWFSSYVFLALRGS